MEAGTSRLRAADALGSVCKWICCGNTGVSADWDAEVATGICGSTLLVAGVRALGAAVGAKFAPTNMPER